MLYKLRWPIALFITCAVAALFSLVAWLMVMLSPANPKSTGTISHELASGTSVDELASQLEAEGIIRSAPAFSIWVTLKGMRSDLQAGTYELNPNDSTPEIASIIAQGRVAENKMVVPEGADLTKILALASAKGIKEEEFTAALKATYPHDFLVARPDKSSLEGYLFPDTYTILKPARPRAVIKAMLDNFSAQVSKADLVKGFAAEGLTLHQGVTLASIVEKEAPGDADRALIAGVFFNRLKAGKPLETDTTIEYIASVTGQPFNLKADSPYNTYLHPGLPPGPICNPGLAAMKAVAKPQASEYLYFLADKQGKVYYAKTFEEHSQNVAAHLNK